MNITFISGEQFQHQCYYYLGLERDFNYNKNLNKKNKNLIDLSKQKNIIDNTSKPLVFCYTHYLQSIDHLVKILNLFKHPFILIFHNSDHAFQKKHLSLYTHCPKLKHIFSQNLEFVNDMITPIPIGIANSQWTHGNTEIINAIRKLSISKTKSFYFYFEKDTNYELRNDCYMKLKDKLTFGKRVDYLEYLKELASCTFCICPPGNGLDTYRLWESLYLDVIPITLRNPMTEYFSKLFPIILLDDWDAFDMDSFKSYKVKKINDYCLNFNYYRNILREKEFSISSSDTSEKVLHTKPSSYEIVLVCIGQLQEHILVNIHNLLLFHNKITILTEKKLKYFFYNIPDINLVYVDSFDLNYYDSKHQYDNSFRGGFWNLVSKRFFILYEYIKQYKKTYVIHVENDVLIYSNFKDFTFGNYIYVTQDTKHGRIIPGIMYIPNVEKLEIIIKNYNFKIDDMKNLQIMRYQYDQLFKQFPILPNVSNIEKWCCEHYNQFNGIFDGAAIGQYLGGIDARNIANNQSTIGFVNPHCDIDFSNYHYIWKIENDIYIPYIKIDKQEFKIFSLHIHSKNLDLFVSTYPEILNHSKCLIPLQSNK